jgi:hypothetical protein
MCRNSSYACCWTTFYQLKNAFYFIHILFICTFRIWLLGSAPVSCSLLWTLANTLESGTVQLGNRRLYYLHTARAFPLQNPQTNTVLAYSACVKTCGIFRNTTKQHQVTTAATCYSESWVPVICVRLARASDLYTPASNSCISTHIENWTHVYMNLFTWNNPYCHLLKYLLFLLKHSVYEFGNNKTKKWMARWSEGRWKNTWLRRLAGKSIYEGRPRSTWPNQEKKTFWKKKSLFLYIVSF